MPKNSLSLAFFIVIILAVVAAGQDDEDPWNRPGADDYPRISDSAKTCRGFAPKGWRVMKIAEGDLNQDRRSDCVLIVRGRNAKFVYKNDGFGTREFDTNPRILIIAFRDAGGFRLAEQNNSFIINADSPTMTEPFQDLEIKNGVLRFYFEEFYSMGTYFMAARKYVFRFQEGEFVLIGAEKTETHRATGEIETRSYNFSTGKMSIENGRIDDDGRGKVRWASAPSIEKKTLKTVPPPMTWEIEPDYFL